MNLPSLRKALLAWYRRARRDLPWRRTRDPYAILVSEIMLQQTTVATVTARWQRFLRRFPDVGSLAGADVAQVVEEWRGLGYYSRARNLHRAAGVIMQEFQGRFPAEVAELALLPGVGAYTAAAVASIAFDRPAAVVDANVLRVMARLGALRLPIDTRPGREAVTRMASELLEQRHPGDWNQAVMELGALVCLPQAPACPACPLADHCLARSAGLERELPLRQPKQAMKAVRQVAVLLHDRQGRVGLVQRPSSGSFAGMWELPWTELAEAEEPGGAAESLARRHATGLGAAVKFSEYRHTVMRTRIHLLVFEIACNSFRGGLNGFVAMESSGWLNQPTSTTQHKIAVAWSRRGEGKGPLSRCDLPSS